MIQDVLGLPVELAAPFDFSFLARYGTPFCVFDQQQSGNIAFGMQSAQWGKLFVKFAGAPTVNAALPPRLRPRRCAWPCRPIRRCTRIQRW